jgi:DNA-binding transcriptional LysR family regulator
MISKNIRNIDLNLLVVFDAVYATGNISHAARQLSLTQPAVSNAIARLREHFNDPLFVRAGRGVRPTIRSQQMIESIRDALRIIRAQLDGEAEIDLSTYKRQFRIVVADPIEPLLIPPLLRAIDGTAPYISIATRPASHTMVIDELMAGTLDLACYPFLTSRPELVIVPLMPCEHVVVARRDHPRIGKVLDRETFMALGQVAMIPELRGHVNIDRDITTRAGARRIIYQVNKVWSVPAIIGNTDLVTVLPRRFAEYAAPLFDLTIHPSPVPISEQEFHMMWHEKNTDDPGHRWLRESILLAVGQKVPDEAMKKRRVKRPSRNSSSRKTHRHSRAGARRAAAK